MPRPSAAKLGDRPPIHVCGSRRFAGQAGLPSAQCRARCTQTHLNIVVLRLHQLARRQQCARLLRRQRLAITGRNRPSRIRSAILRASLRSVFTGNALHAPRTCRVSKLHRKPRAPHPASRHTATAITAQPPIRYGSAQTLACETSQSETPAHSKFFLLAQSQPVASITHPLPLSTDTSIPA
jgi:hypothetical protein